MLSGTGSNVYIHLLCQEQLAYDLVNEYWTVVEETIDREGVQETPYPGRCAVETAGPLPDCAEYLGWRVKSFLDPIEEKW